MFCLSWEPVSEELNGVHGGNQRVHMVLRKVATVTSARVSRHRVEYASKAAYTRSLPLRFTCPDSGANSLVKSLILASLSQIYVIERTRTYKVDFPAPFDPTIARRESRPTSKLTRFKIIFAGSYPNVTSESCSNGGEIFSVSGKLYMICMRPDITDVGQKSHAPEALSFLCCRWRELRKLCCSIQIFKQLQVTH